MKRQKLKGEDPSIVCWLIPNTRSPMDPNIRWQECGLIAEAVCSLDKRLRWDYSPAHKVKKGEADTSPESWYSVIIYHVDGEYA